MDIPRFHLAAGSDYYALKYLGDHWGGYHTIEAARAAIPDARDAFNDWWSISYLQDGGTMSMLEHGRYEDPITNTCR